MARSRHRPFQQKCVFLNLLFFVSKTWLFDIFGPGNPKTIGFCDLWASGFKKPEVFVIFGPAESKNHGFLQSLGR